MEISVQQLTITSPHRACVEASDIGLNTWHEWIVVYTATARFDFQREIGGFFDAAGEDLGGFEYRGPGGCVLTVFND